METLIDRLRSRAEREAGKTAFNLLHDDGSLASSLTYGALDRRACAVGAWLAGMTRRGDRVLLLYPQGLEFLQALYGCFYAGLIAVPAPPPERGRLHRTLPRLRAVIRDSAPAVILTIPQVVEAIGDVLSEAPDLADARWLTLADAPAEEEQGWSGVDARGEDLAVLQYTSGSTADPKGVMITHAHLLRGSDFLKEGFRYSAESRSLIWVPNFHDDGLVQGAVHSVCLGFECFLMSPLAIVQRPARWLQAISRHGITHSGGPNFAYALCVRKVQPREHADLDLSTWQTAYNAAEPVRGETLRAFYEAFRDAGFRWETFCPAFGLAETTLLVASKLTREEEPRLLTVDAEALERHNRVEVSGESKGARTYVACGRGLLDARIAIVDPETRVPVGPDEVGEVWISASCVAAGYWQRPEATARTFAARLADEDEGAPFLRTGDLGFLNDGELFLTGRLKDLIIIRGRNVYPQDVELTVERSDPSLRPGCGVAFPVEVAGEERLVLVQELDVPLPADGGAGTFSSIRRAVLEQHELDPHAIVLIERGTIPKTSSGKLQRRAARAAFLEGGLAIVAQWHAQEQGAPVGSRTEPRQDRSLEAIRQWLVAYLAREASLAPGQVDEQSPFSAYGLESVQMVGLANDLETWLGKPVAATVAYDHPTIERLARFVAGGSQEAARPRAAREREEPIAIVGIGCRFPGASSPVELWHLLREGFDAIREVPPERWNADQFYDPDPSIPGKANTRWGGFLAGMDLFDAGFFGISPREADFMDPQQRLLLEVAWETFEDAAIDPDRLAGGPVGVFVGISSFDYARLLWREASRVGAYAGTGGSLSIAANRLSYFFGFHGPSLAVDTACSSSLVAVHQAMRSLRSGECAAALAGGVNLVLLPEPTIGFSQARMMSSDGRCRAFAAGADGYVRAEGCGLVLLKPLSAARADGDRILAVLRGSAVNQDGRSNGLTAPNGPSQQEVIRLALADAGLSPGRLQYIEAHGTGTALGDPIELQALAAVLAEEPARRRCRVGSIKTNIGHLESAAGIAGLLKVVLALRHGEIPPHLHLDAPNPYLRFSELPLEIPTRLESWPVDGETRVAGVSSFGFGGTNSHVILEEAPLSPAASPEEISPWLLPLSARTPEALRALALRYAETLEADAAPPLADACFTAATGRASFEHRCAVVGSSSRELADTLRTAEGPGVLVGQAGRERPRLAFVFTGQGAQYPAMARELYETEPVFRRVLESCDRLWSPASGPGLLAVLYGGSESSELIHETSYTQPALFAVEVGLAELWRSWGIEPDAVLGHSIGEIAAACVAGVFSMEDGLRLAAERGRLIQERSPVGAMAAVAAAVEEISEVILRRPGALAVAAMNGPRSTTISGEPAALDAAVAELEAAGFRVRRLRVARAFHSPLMEPVLEPFAEVAARIRHAPPRIPFFPCVQEEETAAETLDAGHWLRHLRSPVAFLSGVRRLAGQGFSLFLEVGPKPDLCALGKECLDESVWLPSLRPVNGARARMLESLGALWVRGIEVDWSGPCRGTFRQRVALPSYPFERRRYWLDLAPSALAADPAPLSSVAQEKASGDLPEIYEMAWEDATREGPPPPPAPGAASWILLLDHGGVGERLASLLEAAGQTCLRVLPDDGFSGPDECVQLVAAATSGAAPCRGVIHLWGLDTDGANAESLEADVERTCGSALWLMQALPVAGGDDPPRLWLVTRGAQTVEGTQAPLSVAQAPLWGLGRTCALEQPGIWGGLVDLDPQGSLDDAATGLRDVLWAGDGEDQTAFRARRRFVARLVRGHVPAGDELKVREGTYLVTGGLWGLGLEVARWLVGRGARHLILVGRSKLPPRSRWQEIRAESAEGVRIAALRELEEAGARVLYAAVDVADPGSLAEVLAEARNAGMPPVHGAVHAASVWRDERGRSLVRTLDHLDAAALRAVFRPKVAGAWSLASQLREEPLDFLIFFSSAAALLGSEGQGNYTAANAFLDALAQDLRAAGRPAVSFGWGPVADSGFAATPEGARLLARWDERGFRPLSPSSLLDALAALARGPAQVAVTHIDWARLVAAMPALVARPWTSRLHTGPAPSSSGLLRRLESAGPEQVREVLAGYLRDEIARVMRLGSAAQVDVGRGFFEMGFDSLMVLELRNRLQADLGRPVPSTLLFNYPSVAALSGRLAEQLCGQERAPASAARPDRREAGPAADIGDLSDAQVELLLLRKLDEM